MAKTIFHSDPTFAREIRDTSNMQRIGHVRVNRLFYSYVLEARQHMSDQERTDRINIQLRTHAATTVHP